MLVFIEWLLAIMSPRVAKLVFIGLVLISIPVGLYPLWMIYQLTESVTARASVIRLDTGLFYCLLATVFWPMYWLESTSSRKDADSASPSCLTAKFIVAWFVVVLVVVNGLIYTAESALESRGYTACKNPLSINRTSRGESLIYSLHGC